jgi:hypothetical protein
LTLDVSGHSGENCGSDHYLVQIKYKGPFTGINKNNSSTQFVQIHKLSTAHNILLKYSNIIKHKLLQGLGLTGHHQGAHNCLGLTGRHQGAHNCLQATNYTNLLGRPTRARHNHYKLSEREANKNADERQDSQWKKIHDTRAPTEQ